MFLCGELIHNRIERNLFRLLSRWPDKKWESEIKTIISPILNDYYPNK